MSLNAESTSVDTTASVWVNGHLAARHEGGAASMADGWARTAGRTGLLTVHQGPGLTNAVTGITEAAKSRTPLLVLAADVAATAVLLPVEKAPPVSVRVTEEAGCA